MSPMVGTGDIITIALTGDAMLGRGIDQILARPSQPGLYEPYISSALSYVELAEQAHGAIPRRVDPAYVWGDALTIQCLPSDRSSLELRSEYALFWKRCREPPTAEPNRPLGQQECVRRFDRFQNRFVTIEVRADLPL